MSEIPPYDGKNHFWVVAVVHAMPEDDVLLAHAPHQEGGGMRLSEESIVLVPPPYCFHCQKLWAVCHDEPCSGDPVAAQTQYDLARAAKVIEREADKEEEWDEFFREINPPEGEGDTQG